jgi:hypothetical protein
MKKTNALLIVLAAILVVVTAVECGTLTARVTRVNSNKGHVNIDKGKEAGFIRGAEVCFYSSSGEKITCGQVFRTSATNATVKVNNRVAKKIRTGMEAIIAPDEASVKDN